MRGTHRPTDGSQPSKTGYELAAKAQDNRTDWGSIKEVSGAGESPPCPPQNPASSEGESDRKYLPRHFGVIKARPTRALPLLFLLLSRVPFELFYQEKKFKSEEVVEH
jgi:hypothetical protein